MNDWEAEYYKKLIEVIKTANKYDIKRDDVLKDINNLFEG